MLFAKWILFVLVGKIIIHIWMLFHLPKSVKKWTWLEELHGCDLCSGVWAYSILSFFTELDLLDVAGFGYIPIIGAIVTGIIISWAVHIFTLGWKAKYEVIVI